MATLIHILVLLLGVLLIIGLALLGFGWFISRLGRPRLRSWLLRLGVILLLGGMLSGLCALVSVPFLPGPHQIGGTVTLQSPRRFSGTLALTLLSLQLNTSDPITKLAAEPGTQVVTARIQFANQTNISFQLDPMLQFLVINPQPPTLYRAVWSSLQPASVSPGTSIEPMLIFHVPGKIPSLKLTWDPRDDSQYPSS